MSGKKHHNIPQLFLRGFLIEHTGKTEKAWVFSSGKKPYVSSIKDIAAQRFFYTQSLDDNITDYESNRLNHLVLSFREKPFGQKVDSCIAAEIVTHLAIRTSHIRNVIEYGMTKLLNTFSMAYSDFSNCIQLMGLNQISPSDLFQKSVTDSINEFKILGIPEQIIINMSFILSKEIFFTHPEKVTNFFENILVFLNPEIRSIVISAHNKSLSKTIIPEERKAYLSNFLWTIQRCTSNSFILPDCVVVGLDASCNFQPFFSISNEDLKAILLPLTSNKLLVGFKNKDIVIDVDTFNKNAVTCCESYFIASENTPDIEELAKSIGVKSSLVFDQQITDWLRDNTVQEICRENAFENETYEQDHDISLNFLSLKKGISFQLTFSGVYENDFIEQITEIVKCIVMKISQFCDLDRLDGITFTDDYNDALLKLDRGYPNAASPKSNGNDNRLGIAMSPLILREGLVKSRIIMRSEIAYGLLRHCA